MDILYVAHKYDYGDPARGYAYEHHNFFDSLVAMGHRVQYFDFPTIAADRGRLRMNRYLTEIVRSERPDLLFAVMWGDLVEPAAIREISENTDTVTCNWFCDDHWKFEIFSRRWAPQFNYAITTAACALPRYRGLTGVNVLKSQWACNARIYRPLDETKQYDVSFVGLPHGRRREYVEALQRAGVDVHVWGEGWGGGRVSQDEMIRIFSASRINLNFSESSTAGDESGWEKLTRRCIRQPLRQLPGGWRVSRAIWGRRDRPAPPRQIKGRNFEVPGCGAMLLTQSADELADCYIPGVEVGCFGGVEDLVDKTRYYLNREQEREAVAAAGRQRTLREHTYRHRFEALFREMGLAEATPQREAA